jgi:hypothetical protein
MAEHSETPLREDTYSGFMRMVKVGTVVVAILAAIVVVLISN